MPWRIVRKAMRFRLPSIHNGEPWTEGGFNASWRTFKKRLEVEGLIEAGLTVAQAKYQRAAEKAALLVCARHG
jgi:hypothetical protein